MASKKEGSKKKGAPTSKQIEDWINNIHYSDRYSDDEFEFRHVILPKPFLQVIPKHLFNPDKSGTLRLLTETEWRAIGIRQSTGWEHYEVHTPEPHVLLFRRAKDVAQPVIQEAKPVKEAKRK